MNIKEAKEQIKRAVSIYLAKDEFNNYRIPVEKQRPVFLIGAPGIGKTAIMEQIADELDIAIVSYSMTHHTRQSALGLPFITQKTYEGKEFNVSEYTMSEIISSVYETMKSSGRKEGILFLDEINCVSETLAPSMLQFLQYKTFGNHRIPKGWVVCTAGNPPEYNRSVHEFDVVTMDRLKVMEAEADYETWKIYAIRKGIHKVIMSYLDIKQGDFYHIENTAEGKAYVTARGWEDLSEALFLYEEKGFPVDETLISQYIRDKRVSGAFATYYELYEKYKSDYGIRKILEEGADNNCITRAGNADFDERITVISLLLSAVMPCIDAVVKEKAALKEIYTAVKEKLNNSDDILADIDGLIEEAGNKRAKEKAAGNINAFKTYLNRYVTSFYKDIIQEIKLKALVDDERFNLLKSIFNARINAINEKAKTVKGELDNIFDFVEKAYGDDNEMLLLVTDLTVNKESAKFITENGCDKYYRYNKKLMLHERNKNLLDEIEEFNNMKNEQSKVENI